MSQTRHVPTAEEAMQALRGHVVELAHKARARHGPVFDRAALDALLADGDCVRFGARIVFDASRLLPGEFAHAERRGEGPGEGFDLVVHPRFEGRDADLPLLVAYHIVSINYLDVAAHEEAELYGAALLGLDVEDYYQRVCALADEVGTPEQTRLDVPGWQALGLPDARMPAPAPAPSAGGCACGAGGSSCSGDG